VSKGHPLLFMLKEQDGWESATGRTIVQELEYAEGRFQWYAGYDILDISPSDVITAAEYPWAQAAAVVAANGLEIDVQNTGKEQIINLFKGRIGQRRAHHEEPAHLRHVLPTARPSAARSSAACSCWWQTIRLPEPWAHQPRDERFLAQSVLPRDGRWWRCNHGSQHPSLHG